MRSQKYIQNFILNYSLVINRESTVLRQKLDIYLYSLCIVRNYIWNRRQLRHFSQLAFQSDEQCSEDLYLEGLELQDSYTHQEVKGIGYLVSATGVTDSYVRARMGSNISDLK